MFLSVHAEHEVSFLAILNFWYKGIISAKQRLLFIISCEFFRPYIFQTMHYHFSCIFRTKKICFCSIFRSLKKKKLYSNTKRTDKLTAKITRPFRNTNEQKIDIINRFQVNTVSDSESNLFSKPN